MKKILFTACLCLIIAAFSGTAARADDSQSSGSILTFFGVSGSLSCSAAGSGGGLSSPSTSVGCNTDPTNGIFNSIGCQVMQSFNTSVTPLYCSIIQSALYLQAVNAAMLLYVIFIGFGFLTGITQVELGVVAGKIFKAVFVYSFAVNADVYFAVIYNMVISTPDQIVQILLSTATPTGGSDATATGGGAPQNFFQFVDQGIYGLFTNVVKQSMNEANGQTYDKSNLKVVLMGLALWQIGGDVVGGLFMTIVIGWLVTYFGIMIRYLLAQLSLMFLLMLGPFFIPMLLFKRFEDLAFGWMRLMIAFITQIVLVVAFVLLVQHFFVDFYHVIEKGMKAAPVQESSTNHLVKYGDNAQKVESKPGISNQDAETAVNGILGGDWKQKLPNFTVQLLIMGVIVLCAAQFIKFVPDLANEIADRPSAPVLADFGGRGNLDLFKTQQNKPSSPRDFLNPVR